MENPTLAPSHERFQLAEYSRAHYCVTAEHGTTFAQMKSPDYWAHVAKQLKPYTILECRNEDGAFWGQLLVLESGRNWAKVHEIMYIALETKDVAMTKANPDYLIEFKGPVKKYCVIRNKDHEVLQDGLSKADAHQWLDEYVKVT